MRRRDAALRRSLALADVIAGYLSLAIAVATIPGQAVSLRPAVLLIGPVIVVISKALGLYDRDEYKLSKTTIDEAPVVLHMAVLCALIIWLAQGLIVDGQLARGQVFALAAASLALTLVCRAIARAVAVAVSSPERCLVVGSAVDAKRTADKLSRSPGVKAEIAGRVPITDEGSPVSGSVSELPALIEQHAIERVIIAPDGHDEETILHCIRLVKVLGVKVSVVPRLLEVVGTSAVFDELQGTTFLGVRQYGLSKSSELLKRLTDIVVAAVTLVLVAPLFVLLSTLICLDSRGWPLYRQLRIGRHGECFSMFKFRSMIRGADALKNQYRDLNEVEGGLFKIVADPRITRIGRVLRRTSLDELPQLLNVLRGDMSLVGPRPLVVDEDALIEGWQRRRLALRPGMTGLWQISGSARIPLPEMVKIDYLYGANWSIWLDLKILLRTVPYVVSCRGA